MKSTSAKVKLGMFKNYSINSKLLEDRFSNSSYSVLVFIPDSLKDILGLQEYNGFSRMEY